MAIPVTSIYVVGDSNVLTFRGLMFDLPQFFSQPLVTNACYVPGLSAASLFADDKLNERVRSFLAGEVGVDPLKRRDQFVTDAEAAYRRQLDVTLAPPVEDEWNLPRAPIVVLMLGTLDLLAIVSEIGPAADFHCDDPAFSSASFPEPRLPLIPSDSALRLIERRFETLASGLTALRALGAMRLYLHSLHPPTLDDAVYYRMRGAMCSAKVRYKVAVAINRVLKRIARSVGVGFVDAWARTTRGGVLDPQYSLDGDHLNRSATYITLEELLTDAVIERARPIPSGELTFLDR